MHKNDQDGNAADGIKLWDLLSHGRRQRLNTGSQIDVERLAYVSTVREQKGQMQGEEAPLDRQRWEQNYRHGNQYANSRIRSPCIL